MKSCVIVYNRPSEHAGLDELDVLDQALFVKKNLGECGWEVSTLGLSNNFYEQLADFKNSKNIVFFNIAEAVYNKGELNHFIPAIMDCFNYKYSGNSTNSLFVTTNKLLTKKVLSEAGLRTPDWYIFSDLNCLYEDKNYIIKPIREDASIGIEEKSIIDISEVKKLNKSKLNKLRGSFIEEYIDGREFNVSILSDNGEPIVLPIAEIDFVDFPDDKPKIVGYDAKWNESSFEYSNTVRKFNTIDNSLVQQLKSIAKQCWYLFDLKGYARIDFRVNSEGEVFILEINANPCIAANSGFIASIKEAGISFNDMFNKIMCDLNNS
jgi:D-alanine-D-alanine ligase